VSAMLRVAAVFSFAWAIVLLGLKGRLLVSEHLSPVPHALVNGLAILYLVLTYLFWYAARDPGRNRGIIHAAIMLVALKTATDLYDLLVLLPPQVAVISLGDLVVSVGLLVGILQALPGTLAAARSNVKGASAP
jgi:hypothetical protein